MRIISRLLPIFLYLLCCSHFQYAFAQDEDDSGDEDEVTESNSTPETSTTTQPKDAAATGLFLGQIAAIDKKSRYIFIRPSAQIEGPRQTFYIDKATIYRRANKKSKLDDFKNGEKVGIRYISHNGLYLALGVFYIEGDTVDLADVKMPPSYKR